MTRRPLPLATASCHCAAAVRVRPQWPNWSRRATHAPAALLQEELAVESPFLTQESFRAVGPSLRTRGHCSLRSSGSQAPPGCFHKGSQVLRGMNSLGGRESDFSRGQRLRPSDTWPHGQLSKAPACKQPQGSLDPSRILKRVSDCFIYHYASHFWGWTISLRCWFG